jgi:hypothetical protein
MLITGLKYPEVAVGLGATWIVGTSFYIHLQHHESHGSTSKVESCIPLDMLLVTPRRSVYALVLLE